MNIHTRYTKESFIPHKVGDIAYTNYYNGLSRLRLITKVESNTNYQSGTCISSVPLFEKDPFQTEICIDANWYWNNDEIDLVLTPMDLIHEL